MAKPAGAAVAGVGVSHESNLLSAWFLSRVNLEGCRLASGATSRLVQPRSNDQFILKAQSDDIKGINVKWFTEHGDSNQRFQMSIFFQ